MTDHAAAAPAAAPAPPLVPTISLHTYRPTRAALDAALGLDDGKDADRVRKFRERFAAAGLRPRGGG